jgi:hypothetical protein
MVEKYIRKLQVVKHFWCQICPQNNLTCLFPEHLLFCLGTTG